MPTASELPINTSASAMDMANSMFGSGIDIQTATYTGSSHASGIYSDGDSVAPDITPSDTGVILSTGRVDSVTNSSGDANVSSGTSTANNTAGDSDLDALSGVRTYDAAVFEATFVPQGSVLTMQVVFSSEEYLEYVDSGFNDAVGIWVNGVKAELTVGDGDITINNINDDSNSNLYVDNPRTDEVANTEMDGFTVTLTLKAPVNPDTTNTIKIGIADGGDRYYDSNLLIAGDSIQTALVAGDDEVTVDGTQPTTLDVLGNDSSAVGGTLTITHINGQPVGAGDSVTLATGEIITLNADGTFTVQSDGDEGENVFTYTVEDEDGNIDTAFVTVETVPCFVAGSLIDTPTGPVPVEDLQPGMMVLTRDDGAQRLRWIGKRRTCAQGSHAPVIFEPGALGDHGRVAVSPNHRVLVDSARAELLFGQAQVLVKAAFLIDGDRVWCKADGRDVIYVHLLFDRHQIVTVNGMPSESYHPGDQSLDGFDNDTRDEILDLMPELRPDLRVYGPSARPALKSYEGRILAGHH